MPPPLPADRIVQVSGFPVGGSPVPVFVWYTRSGERSRVRVLWWPLLLSVVLSVLLTVALNSR